MRPPDLKTRIFLDSGDPKETQAALELMGFLDGQTTNPSLIAKSPEAQERLKSGKKFSAEEVFSFYRQVVQKISALIPQGSVSIEVYAAAETKAEAMLMQAREFFKWIPNAHIKFPTTTEGLKAAEIAVKEGMRANMTLVFSQEQAAAVYAATTGAKKGEVFLSPFIGRLDDRGENGMDLISNIIKMYGHGDGLVEVLVASVRSMEHFMKSIELGADIITASLKILKQWAELGMPAQILDSKPESFRLQLPEAPADGGQVNLKPIAFQEIGLDKPWQEYNLHHELTDKGIEKFAADWNALIA